MRFDYGVLFAVSSLLVFANSAIAQSIQPGDSGTVVTPVGNQLNITGNQVSGKNQFHHFRTFNVDAGQTANFIPNNAAIQNILSRVSGGTPSQIQGLIQSSHGVNLFLMNPAGIVFGNGASLNLNGSFTATTANAIGFGNNQWFNAIGSSNLATLTGDPTHFAFTSNSPGSIVNTGNLILPANKSLNLIGGTVINTGTIATPGGNITIAAVEGGKAVQISEPGSLLSYKLPIEALNSINPAIGNPVSLPELLTGNPLDHASGIEIKNGVVTLVRSQTQLSDQSGLAGVSGTMTTSGEEGGSINILGKTIAIADPTVRTQGATILVDADRRLIFEDQADNELTISNFNHPSQSLTLKANSTDGIIESIDPNDAIAVHGHYGGLLEINASTIRLSNLQTAISRINLTAINDIKTGDIRSGGIIATTKTGNIKVGHLTSEGNIMLTANLGNIEAESIQASANYDSFALDVFAGGTFRAIGTIKEPLGNLNFSGDRYFITLNKADPEVLNFLSNKTGVSKDALAKSFDYYYVYAPVSIATRSGEIRIRYAGGGLTNFSNSDIILQGGDARFEIGGKATLGIGDPYIPDDPSKSWQDYRFNNFFHIKQNATYIPIVISEGASGTVGAIIQSGATNGILGMGIQDRSFGVLPPKLEPKPDPQPAPSPKLKESVLTTPTIDLENRNSKQLAICPPASTIALAPPVATRSPEASPNLIPASAKSSPCTPGNNDEEILKILK